MADLRWPTYRPRGVILDEVISSERGGSWRLRDAEGGEYLDAIGGIGCCPVGHAHPAWVDAITHQLGKLAACANSFATVPQQRLAARLKDLFPVDDARAFLCNTGTEATEAALKIALRSTGREREARQTSSDTQASAARPPLPSREGSGEGQGSGS